MSRKQPIPDKRVVIADDHTLFRLALMALVERAGYQVVGEAANGQEAVSAVERHRPALALLDLSMPLLNGIDAGREISADAGRPGHHVRG